MTIRIPLTKAQTREFAARSLVGQVRFLSDWLRAKGANPDTFDLWGFDFSPGTVFLQPVSKTPPKS